MTAKAAKPEKTAEKKQADRPAKAATKEPHPEKLAAQKRRAAEPVEDASAAVAVADFPRVIQTPRLKALYVNELRPRLWKELALENINQVPRLVKIVINAGLGEGTKEFKIIEEMTKDIATITGQKPIIRRASKDVSAFGVRAGNPIGLMVTLRNKRMYEFLDRFIYVTLPRVRDFRGIPANSFDGRGNLTIGVKEHTVFAEINIEKVFRTKGLNITFVTTAREDSHAKALLEAFGIPFSDKGK